MKRIKPSSNEHHWPRNAVTSVECRKRDLVVRISDWSRQSLNTGEPAYDVECYIGGVYDFGQSKTFTLRDHKTKAKCKALAIEYAAKQIGALL
jgi:hypothetical protein